MIKRRTGSVVLFSLMFLSIILLLTQQLIRGVFVGANFTRIMVDREQAEILALSGVNIAMAQLRMDDDKGASKKEDTTTSKDKEKKDEAKLLLQRVLPYLNRWQDFVLQEKLDGIDGLIRVCITCESGKININEAFDFKKMEFKREFALLLKGLEIRGRLPAGEMFKRLVEFFKKRKRKLDDISELHQIIGFEKLDIFYRPPELLKKGKKGTTNPHITLQDIFTIWSPSNKIDPLWLSDALCAVFSLRRPLATDSTSGKGRFEKFIKTFKKEMAGDWYTNWKVLEILYDQKPKIIPEIKSLFTKEFGPKVFSVLSCGKVGQVEQYVLAVIREETKKEEATDQTETKREEEKKEQKTEGQKKPEKFFRLLRVYWL